MSIQAVAFILEGHPAKGAERLVLLSLANHANAAMESWPGVERIAWEANLTGDHVRRCLRALDTAGWITRSVNAAPDDRIRGDRRPNLYRIITDGIDARVRVGAEVLPAAATGTRTTRPRVGEPRGDGYANDAPTGRRGSPTEPSVEPSGEPSEEPSAAGAAGEMFPPKPEPSPAKDPLQETAREVARVVWEGKDPKPAGKGAFMGLCSVAHALLVAGHDRAAIEAGMLAASPVTIRTVEFVIAQSQRATANRAKVGPVDTDRDAPAERLYL